MSLPRGLRIYELRAKRGRRHVVMYRYIIREDTDFSWIPREKINGPVRWYTRRRGERFKPATDWLPYSGRLNRGR